MGLSTKNPHIDRGQRWVLDWTAIYPGLTLVYSYWMLPSMWSKGTKLIQTLSQQGTYSGNHPLKTVWSPNHPHRKKIKGTWLEVGKRILEVELRMRQVSKDYPPLKRPVETPTLRVIKCLQWVSTQGGSLTLFNKMRHHQRRTSNYAPRGTSMGKWSINNLQLSSPRRGDLISGRWERSCIRLIIYQIKEWARRNHLRWATELRVLSVECMGVRMPIVVC